MTLPKFAATALVICTLAACGAPVQQRTVGPVSKAQQAEIKQRVAYGLKDPASAQFRAIRAITELRQDGTSTSYVCGEVNGRNSFGGYVGFRTFKGNFENGSFRLHGIGDNDNNWIYNAVCPVG